MAAIHALFAAAPRESARWLVALHDAAATFCRTGDMLAAVTVGVGGPLLRSLRD